MPADDVLRQVKKFWENKFEGLVSDPNQGMSVEDKRALANMKDLVELVNGHHRLGLPGDTRLHAYQIIACWQKEGFNI